MQSAQLWDQWLAPYQPQLPLDALVQEVNKLFHQFEADSYDRRHPQVFEQGAQLWQEMIPAALADRPSQSWRILDFGCGTGFASSQLLQHLGADRIERLVCYDLSPQMLQQCRARIAPLFSQAHFCHAYAELMDLGPFDLLATNSLLHHLPDPLGTIRELAGCLTAAAAWLLGQEPSSRFYRNPACLRHYEAFQKQRHRRSGWGHFASPHAWRNRFNKLFGRTVSPKALTAKAAHRQGLFKRRPPARLIDRLVDFHVAHSVAEADAGRGFDYHQLQQQLHPQWRLVWYKSCSYMGPHYEGDLPEEWQAACRALAKDHPEDGANFCAVWRRAG